VKEEGEEREDEPPMFSFWIRPCLHSVTEHHDNQG
jgi:hypothetical protein